MATANFRNRLEDPRAEALVLNLRRTPAPPKKLRPIAILPAGAPPAIPLTQPTVNHFLYRLIPPPVVKVG